MNDVVFMVMQVVQSKQNLLYMPSDLAFVHASKLSICGLQRVRHKFHVYRSFILFFVSDAAIIRYDVGVGTLS